MKQKEREKGVVGRVGEGREERVTGLEEVRRRERSLEVESVVEKLERQVKADKQQQDVSDDVSVSTVVGGSDDQPAVTLPVTPEEIIKGRKLSVWESLRWLAEWATRQIKKFAGRVRYKEGVWKE